MKFEDNNICDTCNTIENATHIVNNCNKHNTIRSKYTSIQTKGLTVILKDNVEKELQELIQFLNEADQHL